VTTTTPPGQAGEPVEDGDQRDAQIRVLEAAAVAAVTASLAARLAAIQRRLRDAFAHAGTEPGRWATARQAAASDLIATWTDIAGALARYLPRAAELGARHIGAPLPGSWAPQDDDQIQAALARVDADVQSRLQRAGLAVLTDEIGTPGQFEDVLGRVDAAAREARAQAGDTIARTVATGAVAAADGAGLDLVWWSERDACLSCTSMAGATRSGDGLFRPVRVLAPRIIPWYRDGMATPPGHRGCRCSLARATPGLADALRREAERSVARGESAYDSLPARLRAVDRLLAAQASRIPKSVRQRAASDRARGRFSDRHTAAAR
jgi:hypothetical protein